MKFRNVVPQIGQIDFNKKKDMEISKLKKDLELIYIQHETEMSNLKKKHQDLINELNDQLEKANKNKHRHVGGVAGKCCMKFLQLRNCVKSIFFEEFW